MGYILLNWSEYYSVGYDVFDNQHKHLIEMINELYGSFITGDVRKKVPIIIEKMLEYSDYHFKTEEKYFDEFQFPDSDVHKDVHQSFIEKVTEFKNGIDSGKISVSYDIMNFLTDWLKNHILGEDKKYGEFFKSIHAEINE